MIKTKYRFNFLPKTFAIICVFLILSTGFTSIYSSKSLFKKEYVESSDNKDYLDSSEDKISNIKGTLSKIRDKINIKNLTQSIPKFTSFLLSNSKSNTSFRFYTNYNGKENSTEIKFFRTVKIDLNDDTKDDISARYIIYPSFDLRSFSLAINVRLIIKKLKDFPDSNASFDAFLEFYFPGLGILKNISGNRIRFGYQSPLNEQIPNRCVITYKFLPNLLKPHKKIEHRLSTNPGDIKKESKIVLLFSYTNFENQDIVYDEKYRVVFNPATSTSIKIGGNKKSDGPNFEFEKASFTKSIIDIYFSHTKNDNSTNLYCLGVPKHILFTYKHGKNGYAEFNSYGDPVEEIGICDDINNPKNKLFFSEFPEKARISWIRDLFPPMGLELNIYSEGESINFGGKLSIPNSGIKNFDFLIDSHSTLDIKLDLDMKHRYLEIERTRSSLTLSIDVVGINGGTLKGSMDIIRFTESPFKLNFDRIIDGEGGIETYISGKQVELRNVHLEIDSSQIGGELKIDMDQCVIGPIYREKISKMILNVSLKIKSASVNGTICLNIIRGVNISNLVVQYNDLKFKPVDINVKGNYTKTYEFTLNGKIDFDFGENFSWGYIKLYGAGAFKIDNNFERNGKKGGVYGLISLKSYKEAVNISWKTEEIDENETRVFNVDGAGLFALKDFHIWFADILDINIPSFNGSLVLENASQKSGNLSLDLNGMGSSSNFEHIGFNFSSDDIIETKKDLTLIVNMENIKRETKRLFSASLNLGWTNYTVANFSINYSAKRNLSIENLSILFKNSNNNFSFISDRFVLNGFVDFEFNSSAFNDITTYNGPILKITTTNSTLDIHIKELSIPLPIGGLNFYNTTIKSHTIGTASISFLEKLSYEDLDESLYPSKLNLNLSRINMTLWGIYADNGNINLSLFEFNMNIPSFSSKSVSNPTFLDIILGLLENFEFIMKNRSLTNGSSFKSFSLVFTNLTEFIQNFTQNQNSTIMDVVNYLLFDCLATGGFNFKVENRFTGLGKHYSKMDILQVNISEITIGKGIQLAKEFGVLDKNFSLLNGKYDTSTFSFFFKNFSMSEGTFDLSYEGLTGIKFNVYKNSSFISNMDIGIGITDICYGFLSFEGSFDNLLFDYNKGINNQSDLVNKNYTTKTLLIDTKNETVHLPDLEIWVEADFINLATEILKNRTGFSARKIKSDIGIRFLNNATFRADEFKITLFTNHISNETKISHTGIIYAKKGDIWVYFNGTWKQIAGGNVSILIEPGHAKIFIDKTVGIPGMVWKLGDGTNFSISGTFVRKKNNITIDVWWNLINGSYLFNISREGSGNFDITIIDFYLNINKKIEIKNPMLNGTEIKSISLSLDEFSISGSGSISLLVNNINFNDIKNNNTKAQLDLDSSIERFNVKNFALSLSGDLIISGEEKNNKSNINFKNFSLSGNFDLSHAGDLSIKINFTNSSIKNLLAELLVNEGIYIFLGLEIGLELDNKNKIYVGGSFSIELRGSGSSGSIIFNDGNLTISGSITNILLNIGLGLTDPLYINGPNMDLTLSGKLDSIVTGGGDLNLVISGSNFSDFSNLSIDARVSGNGLLDISLNDFKLALENKSGWNFTVSGKKLGGDLGASSSIIWSTKDKSKINITLTGLVFGLYLEDCLAIFNGDNTKLKGVYLNGDFIIDIDVGGYFKITVDISNLKNLDIDQNIEISGYFKLSLNDVSISTITDINEKGEIVKGLTFSCKNFQINGYFEFVQAVFEVHNKTHEWTEKYTKFSFIGRFFEIEELNIYCKNSSSGNFTVDGEISLPGNGDNSVSIEFEDPLESVEKNQTIKLGISIADGGSLSIGGRSPNKPFTIKSDNVDFSLDQLTLYGACNLELWLNGPNLLPPGSGLDYFNAVEFINTQPTFAGIFVSNLNLQWKNENILGFGILVNNLDLTWNGKFTFNITFQKTIGNPNSTFLDNIYIDLSGGSPNQVFNLSIDIEGKYDPYVYAHLVIDSLESKGRNFYLRAGKSDNPNTMNPYIEVGRNKNRSIKSLKIELDINLNIPVNISVEINNINSGRKLYAGILFDDSLFDELPSDLNNKTQWLNHFLEHFENLTLRWDGSFSYKNISLSIIVNNTNIKIPILNIPIFTGRVIGGPSIEGAGEIILSFSGKPFSLYETNFTLEGYVSKPVHLTLIDTWRHPLGLFNIEIGTLEISEGEFEISLKNNVSNQNDDLTQDFYFYFYSTCSLELDTLKVEFLLLNLDIIEIGGFEMNGGSMTLDVHRIDWSRLRMEFTSNEMKQDSIDFFLLKIAGKDIIRGIYWNLDCPYLLVEWDIESIPEFPWSTGYIHLDSNGQPVSLTTNSGGCVLVDIINIFGFIIAYDFNISWGSFEKENGFNIIDTEGNLQSDCTIEILVDEIWRHLWPIGGSENHPPTKPQTPDGPSNWESGKKLTYSTSSNDPDGDEIKYGWDWNNDGVIEWWVTQNSRDHIYYTNGETYPIRVKAIDEHGLESDWSDTVYVTISGGTTGSWNSKIDGYNDPGNDWVDEAEAYDDELNTCAISKHCSRFPKWVWTEPLEIVLHDGQVGNCPKVGKIRFKAWYHPNWCEKVDIDAYRYNKYSNKWEWVYLYHGKYYDHNDDWNIIHHQQTYSLKIKKIRIKFYVHETWNNGNGISADLYEIDYWKINE